MPYGYQGKILHLDLGSHKFEIEKPPDSFFRKYMGGSAVGAYYLLKHTPPNVDPFSSENTLVLAPGVVTGAPVAGQSRITAVAKSPLSGAIGDSQSGGFFPAEFKFSGFDALVVHGQSEKPVTLCIQDGNAEIRSADHLMGKTTLEVEKILKEDLKDSKVQILQTGIAGDHRVRYASLIHMANRANGRTGMGAVMGSKRLKAIAVRGSRKPEVYDPESLKDLARQGVKDFPESDVYAMGVYGTAEVVAYQNDVGGLPTHNWDSGVFDGWESLDGRTISEQILVRRDTCYACPIRCKRVVKSESTSYKVDPEYGGPEYETLSTFGSYCGVDDLEAVACANQLCNMYGMDTISCGATISWAMDAFEKGMLTEKDTGGLDLSFGNAEAMVELVRMIAFRQGIGDLLAEGSARAAQSLGRGSEKITVTVKKQELPAHMPQLKPSLGVIYAVNPFGADHQSSEHDPSFQDYPEGMEQLGLMNGSKAVGLSRKTLEFALTTQYLYSAMDSVSVCQFVYGPAWQLYDTEQLVKMIASVTGWDLTIEELLQVGARRLNLFQMFNIREGFTGEDNALPEKLFKPLKGGTSEGRVLSSSEIDKALRIYYQLAGWDEKTTVPTQERLKDLGIEWILREADQP